MIMHGLSLLTQGRVYEWHWEMHPMWWWGWGIGMMLMMVIFWGLIITGLFVAIRWLLGQSRHGHTDTALEILRQRYAKGEINKEEFETRKRDLS